MPGKRPPLYLHWQLLAAPVISEVSIFLRAPVCQAPAHAASPGEAGPRPHSSSAPAKPRRQRGFVALILSIFAKHKWGGGAREARVGGVLPCRIAPPSVAKATDTSPFALRKAQGKWRGPKLHFPTRPRSAKLPPMPFEVLPAQSVRSCEAALPTRACCARGGGSGCVLV